MSSDDESGSDADEDAEAKAARLGRRLSQAANTGAQMHNQNQPKSTHRPGKKRKADKQGRNVQVSTLSILFLSQIILWYGICFVYMDRERKADKGG